MNRSVMKRQMFANGGVPMAEPTLTPPMEPMATGPEQMDPQVLEGAMMTASQNFGDLDQAQNYEEVIDSIRGDELPIEQRYQELAQFVGPNDAQQTPESVLAMVQPVIQMAAVDGGIGGLAAEQMNADVSGPMAEGIMSTIAMEGGEEPPVNFKQGGDARRKTNKIEYYSMGGMAGLGQIGQIGTPINISEESFTNYGRPDISPTIDMGFLGQPFPGFGGGFGGLLEQRGNNAQRALAPFKQYIAQEVKKQALSDVSSQVDPFIDDISQQAAQKFGLTTGGGIMDNIIRQPQIEAVEDPMGLPFLGRPALGRAGVTNEGPMAYADGGPVQYFAPENKNRVVTPLEQEMGSRLDLYERMGLGSQAERDAALANQRNLTQSQMLFDIAGAGLALAGGDGSKSFAQNLAEAAQNTQLFDKLSARTQSLSDFQTAQKKEERDIRLAALTSSEAALAASAKAKAAKEIETMKNAAAILAVETAFENSLTTAENLAETKRKAAEQLATTQTLLQELKGVQGEAADIRRADLEKLVIKLKQENTLINKDIDLQNDLKKIGVNHSNDLQTIELNDAYATKLQDSRLALSEKLSNLDRALGYSKLDLANRTETRNALNAELNQARADKELLIKDGKLKLAQEQETRIAVLEGQKLLIDQAELALKKDDQFFTQKLEEDKLTLEREELKLNKLGGSFDAKVIELISDETLMEAYAEDKLNAGEVRKINNALTSYQIGTPVRDEDPQSPTFGKLIPNPKPLDADTIAFINRRIKKGGNGPAGFNLDNTGGFSKKEVIDLVGNVDGPTKDLLEAQTIYDAYSKNIIKFDNPEDITNATGIWNGLARIVSFGAETLGFCEIAPKSNQAIADLKALNLVTVLSIQKARSSKDTVFSANEIYSILPKVSESQGKGARLLETDSKALRSITSLIPTIQRDIDNQLEALANAPDLETREEIKQNINVLTGLKNTWQKVKDVYSGDFEGSNNENLSTESFLRSDDEDRKN